MKDNGLEYIRKTYGVPAYRGVRVDTGSAQWGIGVITGNDGPYIRVRCDRGEANFHPTDRVLYLIEHNQTPELSPSSKNELFVKLLPEAHW